MNPATTIFLTLSTTLLTFAGDICAKEISVKTLSTEQGLSHPTVNDIYCDEYGFVWIGTYDGLNRFDGQRVDIFRPDGTPNCCTTNFINKICGDRHGHIFILGQHSVQVYDIATSRFSTLMADDVTDICFNDHLYVSTAHEIYRYPTLNGKPELCFSTGGSVQTAVRPDPIRHICVDSRGTIYAAGNDRLLSVSPTGTIATYRLKDIHDIMVDSHDAIWCSSKSCGFFVIDSTGRTQVHRFSFSEANSWDKNNTRRIVQVSDSTYYIGTYDGLMLYDAADGSFTPCTYRFPDRNFTSEAVRSLHFANGILFIGTFHMGVQYHRLDQDIYCIYSPADPGEKTLAAPVVSSVRVTPDRTLWFGTISGGLDIRETVPGTISPDFRERICRDARMNNVKYLHYDPYTEQMWVTTFSEGILCINLRQRTIRSVRPHYTTCNGVTVDNIQNVTKLIPWNENGRECLLVLALNGLLLLDTGTLALTDFSHLCAWEPSDIICDIGLDRNNRLWISTISRLYRIDMTHCQNYHMYLFTSIEPLADETHVTNVFCDQEGGVWFGTSGSGVLRYDEASDSFTGYGAAEGLENRYVNAIAASCISNDIYIATNDGIARLDKRTGRFTNYNRHNGYPFSITNGLYIAADSTLYASSPSGVIAVRETDLCHRRRNYELFVKNFYVNNRPVYPDDTSGILRTGSLSRWEVRLRPEHSVLSFEIVNNTLGVLPQVAFEYMLDGFDSEFVSPLDNNIITYTNLHPGHYTLIVRGTVADENGDYPTVTTSIVVLPPFYKSWWFISPVLLFLFGAGYLLFSSHISRRKLRMKLASQLHEKERMASLNRAKTDFFTNISHEFRTPITLINSHLELLIGNHELPVPLYENVRRALDNTRKLRVLLNGLIDLRKQEFGAVVIRASKNDIVPFLREIFFLFSEYATKCHIAFTFTDDTSGSAVWFDPGLLERAVNNLLSNAFKYTPKDGRGAVELSVREEQDRILIAVTDNGIGIDPQNIDRIWENFWQDPEANSMTSVKGSGIGLHYTREIITLHHGELSVESEPSIRTRFSISLPMKCPFTAEQRFEALSDRAFEEDNPHIAPENMATGVRMVIVEDNDEMREVLQSIFSPYYEVHAAPNGSEGLRIAEHLQPDLVLSDVLMPGISGLEMCRKLKDTLITCHIPVVLLTACDTEAYTLQGFSTGADDYITKPFNTQLLLMRCNNLILNRRNLQQKYLRSETSSTEPLSTNPIDSHLLAQATELIERNIDVPGFDIMTFARELGLSRTNLFNKIKGLTGQTPNNFVISLRLKRAAEMIRLSPESSITQIAYESGFNTTGHFIKCFKRIYGETPLSYRKRCLKG